MKSKDRVEIMFEKMQGDIKLVLESQDIINRNISKVGNDLQNLKGEFQSFVSFFNNRTDNRQPAKGNRQHNNG